MESSIASGASAREISVISAKKLMDDICCVLNVERDTENVADCEQWIAEVIAGGIPARVDECQRLARMECNLCGAGNQIRRNGYGKWAHGARECKAQHAWDRIGELTAPPGRERNG
jgi:hypothetical protein